MRPSNLPALLPPNLDFTEIREYALRNWFKLLLIALGLYILMVKDINFQISMNSALPNDQSEIPAEFWEQEMSLEGTPEPKKKSTAFSFLSTMVTGGAFSKSPKKAESTSAGQSVAEGEAATAAPVKAKALKSTKLVKPTKASANLANNFANLTFVLSPDYAERKQVPREIVEAKIAKCQSYVERFAPVARAEMKKYGIPASITLAQGLLESNVGESRLTKANNNHFGIKCFSKKCRRGHCSNFTDDTHKDFFRVYQSAWESYRAHSAFLQGKRYIHLKQLGTTDYKGWAHGLRKAGYATDKRYAQKIIQIIEFLKLHRYDS